MATNILWYRYTFSPIIPNPQSSHCFQYFPSVSNNAINKLKYILPTSSSISMGYKSHTIIERVAGLNGLYSFHVDGLYQFVFPGLLESSVFPTSKVILVLSKFCQFDLTCTSLIILSLEICSFLPTIWIYYSMMSIYTFLSISFWLAPLSIFQNSLYTRDSLLSVICYINRFTLKNLSINYLWYLFQNNFNIQIIKYTCFFC